MRADIGDRAGAAYDDPQTGNQRPISHAADQRAPGASLLATFRFRFARGGLVGAARRAAIAGANANADRLVLPMVTGCASSSPRLSACSRLL